MRHNICYLSTSSVLLLAFVLSFAISVESTWLLKRACQDSTVGPWGIYTNGDCLLDTKIGQIGYGTCSDSGSEYTYYNCKDLACSNCSRSDTIKMNKCYTDQYPTCSSGGPDFSVFGSSRVMLQMYQEKDCSGEAPMILAAPINTCLNIPGASVLINCFKNDTATMQFYKDSNCEHSYSSITLDVNNNKCSWYQALDLPGIATCTGF